MKNIRLITFLFCLLNSGITNRLMAQADCVLQPPIMTIDFGSKTKSELPGFLPGDNYQRIYDYCPQDGSYALVPQTNNCYASHWIALPQDHTPGDDEGNMLLVNAAYDPGIFFTTPLSGLLPNTTYELAAFVINICTPSAECTNIRPNLVFIIESDGKQIASFTTGDVEPTGIIYWTKYAARFTTPQALGTISLQIKNTAPGGCGNDFALDDISVRECRTPKPIVKEILKPKPVTKTPPPVVATVVKPKPPVITPEKKIATAVPRTVVRDSPQVITPAIKEKAVISIPKPILTRANPVIQQIETTSSEMVIDLYDNGEIDGDTVSVYHNNQLIVSRAGLSDKPISFRFNVDAAHPHHELVMVADNLGSIPPNTSLMIVTSKNKRYEIFISSTEQKNAKIVIDLKNP